MRLSWILRRTALAVYLFIGSEGVSAPLVTTKQTNFSHAHRKRVLSTFFLVKYYRTLCELFHCFIDGGISTSCYCFTFRGCPLVIFYFTIDFTVFATKNITATSFSAVENVSFAVKFARSTFGAWHSKPEIPFYPVGSSPEFALLN